MLRLSESGCGVDACAHPSTSLGRRLWSRVAEPCGRYVRARHQEKPLGSACRSIDERGEGRADGTAVCMWPEGGWLNSRRRKMMHMRTFTHRGGSPTQPERPAIDENVMTTRLVPRVYKRSNVPSVAASQQSRWLDTAAVAVKRRSVRWPGPGPRRRRRRGVGVGVGVRAGMDCGVRTRGVGASRCALPARILWETNSGPRCETPLLPQPACTLGHGLPTLSRFGVLGSSSRNSPTRLRSISM